ncbi:myosin family protein [Skeletonema marinoi]|uniref:Myosin family protein n=1 Tax=Skeletonema marinoi TaxID=267567 RepID=A0AAD8Y7Q0_9STRA|nr:myosin family protein [Skeletonema marinoi]
MVPAVIHDREEIVIKGITVIKITLRDDPNGGGDASEPALTGGSTSSSPYFDADLHRSNSISGGDGYYADVEPFEVTLTIDIESAERDELEDIKTRDYEAAHRVVGGVDDLIGLTHLHEPAILHALRLRYDADIIYTSTGPILIAINPFKSMPLYTDEVMQRYRLEGELGTGSTSSSTANKSSSKAGTTDDGTRLPPHAYQTADDAYRAMMRGIEMSLSGGAARRQKVQRARSNQIKDKADDMDTPTDQSILVSGESGAGKTVTTKIVLNYFAMLSKLAAEAHDAKDKATDQQVEKQVLQSNPILEAFGNARTIRNDNSSRFGKYININFSQTGRLTGASIDTYLLEKVRLIHQNEGERNFHVFYQFLEYASKEERDQFYLGDMQLEDFALVNQSGTYDRRDMVSDVDMHREMIEAMWRGCELDENEASLAVSSLLGVSFENLAASLTSRVLFLREGNVTKQLNAKQAYKASEALIKAIYGANFDYIVEMINKSIHQEKEVKKRGERTVSACIGVLDIFGFETFESNTYEQMCINYTNETLQQHFNKHVFKLEQQEYEREGILWKFISFPDNQDVLDLVEMKRVGIMAQTPYAKFSIEHYAGYVEYSTEEWVEKNKDQLPAASVELIQSSTFDYVGKLQSFVRAEGAGGRGSVAQKSVGAKFMESLRTFVANIVEQLRYSGVLEAVRVSRAGYPIRYTHGVFMNRYYMLGDLGQDGTKRNKDIHTLAKFAAKHVWEADQKKMKARELLAATTQKQSFSERRQAPKVQKRKKRLNAQSNIDIPDTEEEFENLDFGTRCAVAGLQLGRTKMFLRREAFDRIETLRVAILGKSAAVIQATLRGKVQRIRYLRLKKATIKCQAMIRYFLANLEVLRATRKAKLEKWASTMIQVNYRRYKFRNLGAEKKQAMLDAAVIIQAFIRGSLLRIRLDDMMPSRGVQLGVKVDIPEEETMPEQVVVVRTGPTMEEIADLMEKKKLLFKLLDDEMWDTAISLMQEYEEQKLASQQEPESGKLALHIVAEKNLHHVFEHVYNFYPDGADVFDYSGRLPLHIAAEHDALVPVKYLLAKHPDGADTMMLRPTGRSGGGIPLHVACRVNASGAVITALLAHNFNSCKVSDANGDLPIHLLLRNGKHVSGAVVQGLLDTYPTAATRADMYGDLPLSVALKHECKPDVIKTLLMHNPDAAKVQNGRDGHSPLFLAFKHNADDKTILGLMNHAPDLIVAVDKRTGLLPIEMATKQMHSISIVHDLLKRDMPIDMTVKTEAKLVSHNYSWNHIVSDTNDRYYEVVSKVLQQCTQPQIFALSHCENKRGVIALASGTPLCKHEFRVMFRLFRTLEITDGKPSYTDSLTGTQIFYAQKFASPPEKPGVFTSLYLDDKSKLSDIEECDDQPAPADVENIPNLGEMTNQQRLDFVQNEEGVRVIAKLTSRSDIADAEISTRQDYNLSRHYVPAVLSIHHTILNAAYAEAMADPSYCITMEAADTTAENLLLDLRKSKKLFPTSALKSIAMSLLHIHERGLVHGDFGSHNVAQFGDRWKVLGVRASVPVGDLSDPKRGFYHPPEAVSLETRNVSLGEKNVGASVIAIESDFTNDIWGYGAIFYEAIAGLPLSPYRSAHKAIRAREMGTAELFKVGQWDERSLRKALRHINNENAKALAKLLLHPDPSQRVQSMREALEHPFFGLGKLAGAAPTFKRPTPKTPNYASEANTVDINAYSEDYLKNRVAVEAKPSAADPSEVKSKKETTEGELTSPVPSIISPMPSNEIETSKVSTIHSEVSSSAESVEVKLAVPQAAPSRAPSTPAKAPPPSAPVAKAPPTPTPSETKKKSKFGVKKFGFGKK